MSEAGLSDPWLAVAIGLVVGLVVVVALVARRDRRPAPSTDAKLDQLSLRIKVVEDKQGAADHDLRNVRAIVGNLPTKESIAALSVEVAETRGEMRGVQSTLQSQNHSLARIEDFLMKASADALIGRKQANDT